MGTSSSNSLVRRDWTVQVDLFSGRPNPAWTLSEAQVRNLLEIWDGLEPADPAGTEQSPRLGYRGFTLAGPCDERWIAAAGVVTHASSGPTPKLERRSDPPRRFEGALLHSAPAGVLDDSLRNALEKSLAPRSE
jgi:hypothetical protein